MIENGGVTILSAWLQLLIMCEKDDSIRKLYRQAKVWAG